MLLILIKEKTKISYLKFVDKFYQEYAKLDLDPDFFPIRMRIRSGCDWIRDPGGFSAAGRHFRANFVQFSCNFSKKVS